MCWEQPQSKPRVTDGGKFAERRMRLAASLGEEDLTAIILTSPENIYYFCGFATSAYHYFQPLIVHEDGNATFICRAIERANAQSPRAFVDAIRTFDWLEDAPAKASALAVEALPNSGRVGYEAHGMFLSPNVFQRLTAAMGRDRMVAADELPIRLTSLKTAEEIALISAASTAAREAMDAGVAATVVGAAREEIFAAVMDRLLLRNAVPAASMPHIGVPGALAVGRAEENAPALKEGDPVWFQISAAKSQYHGVVGQVASAEPERSEVHRMKKVAQACLIAMMNALQPGVALAEADRIVRLVAKDAALDKFWRHRGGYSMGISFLPGLGEYTLQLAPNAKGVARAGMVFHLCPIFLSPKHGPVGATDTVLVTDDGCLSLSGARHV